MRATATLWAACESVRVFQHVLVFMHRVGAVAKGMPWLRGASQPADSVFLEVAVALSFICVDRPQQWLPALLTGRDSRGAGAAGVCDG